MKRALPKRPSFALPAIIRLCERPECDKILSKTQKKFCSHSCRSTMLSPGNEGGVPDTYKPEYATSKFDEYIALCEKQSEPTLIPTQSSYIVRPKVRLPSKVNYALYLKVHPNTLDNWAKLHTDFAHTLDMLHSIQGDWLINKGLAGTYNFGLVKMMLNVNHGMVERSQVDNTHKLIGVVKHVYARADELERQERLEEGNI